MKKIIFIFLLCCFSIFSNEKNIDATSDDTGKTKALSKYDVTKGLYWASYSTTASFAFINSFAYLGDAITISNDIKDTSNSIKNATNTIMPLFTNTADSLPFIYFGMHFLLAGFAFIPYYGGLLYGSSLYLTGIIFAVIKAFNPIDIFWANELPTNLADSYKQKLKDIHNKMFDPISYFVLGSFSIIFGVLEIISYYFYRKEINKIKYPIMHKILTMVTGEGITIKIEI